MPNKGFKSITVAETSYDQFEKIFKLMLAKIFKLTDTLS